MDKRAIVVLAVVFGGLFFVFFGFLFLAVSVTGGGEAGVTAGGPRIGVIELKGVIGDDKKILEQLKKFREDDSIKAVLVRVDSPGGAVAPSQEIHDAILETRKKKKVVVSMGSVAASGGFYVSVAADEIVANPGTLTGSIGVIMEFPDVSGLASWAKVKMEVVKSGKFKDTGSPFRDMTDDDRQYLHDTVMDVYQQFLGAVAKGRKLPVDKVKPIADGRVLTGEQAKKLGLVDKLGSFDFAVKETARLAGLKGEPTLVYPKKDERELLRRLLSDGARSFVDGVKSEVTKSAASAQSPSLWMLATPR